MPRYDSRRMLNRSCFAIVLPLLFASAHAHAQTTHPATVHTLTIDFDTRFQTIDHFAASDCWAMQKLGLWSEAKRNRVADLLFSTDKGIGLSMWRFNIGGGINTQTISDPFRTCETFEVEEGKYDWTRQRGERWFLAAAKARGVPKFLAFVNSPPGRMTRSGLTNAGKAGGGAIDGSTNLKEGYESQFARYVTDILQHFATNEDESPRVAFDWISPVNEPAQAWDRGQEGNRAGNDDIKRIVRALHAELRGRGLPTRILVPETQHVHDLTAPDRRAGERFGGATYGGYLEDFSADADFAAMISHTLAYHDYDSDGPDRLVSARRRLRAELDRFPQWSCWQTEYCVTTNGHRRDLGMDTALAVARLMHVDLTVANASAWSWWLSVSPYDYKDGLIYTDWKKPGDEETVIESKLLWAFGNFSRFVRPGMTRVAVNGAEDDLEGLLTSAYHDQTSGRIIVVCINMAREPKTVQLQLRGAPAPIGFVPYVTSAPDDENLKPHPRVRVDEAFEVGPRSVVTLVSSP